MRLTQGGVLLAALLSSLVATPVWASPLFELTGGFGGMGALQARHAGPSAASTYFNPALLPDAPPGLTAGVLVLNTDIGVRVDARSPGASVPAGLVDAIHSDRTRLDSYPVATNLLQNGAPPSASMPDGFVARPRQHAGSGHVTQTYEAVGLVVHLIDKRLAVGVYGLLPNVNFTSFDTHYADEREQYFSNSLHPELYGDRLRALSFSVAAGARLTRSLSLGFGTTIGLRADATAPAYIFDAGRLQDLQLAIKADAKVALVPHVGLAYQPIKRLRFTAVVHAPQKIDLQAKFKFLLATGVEQGSRVGFSYDFQPWQAGAGLSYDIVQRGGLVWSAVGSLLYARWSKYIDRQSTRPGGAYEWMDTLSGALGTRLERGPLGVAVDAQYKPSPVPLQTGRSNYVDNDLVGLSLAMEYALSLWNKTWKLGLNLTCWRLISRYQRKLATPVSADGRVHTPQLVIDEVPDDAVLSGTPVRGREGLQTNNPGWPGYSSRGWVSYAGLSLTLLL